MWYESFISVHCQEYENLTIEEKLLVDKEMHGWYASVRLQDLCVPMFIFREAERRIIEELKEKDGKRKRRNANADTRIASKKRDVRTR